MDSNPTPTSKSPVLTVRKATEETQVEFAKRLGVGLRSLKRYEHDGTLPRNQAVMRQLRALAKRHNISIE